MLKRNIPYDLYFVNQCNAIGLSPNKSSEDIRKKLKEISKAEKYFKKYFKSNMDEHYKILGLPLGASFGDVNNRYKELLKEYSLRILQSEPIESLSGQIASKKMIEEAEHKLVKFTSSYKIICDYFGTEDKASFYLKQIIMAHQNKEAWVQEPPNDSARLNKLFQWYCGEILISVSLSVYLESLHTQNNTLNNFHIFSDNERLPKGIKNSKTKDYLIFLKKMIIDPIYSQTVILSDNKNCDIKQDKLLTKCKAFLQLIEDTLEKFFIDYLKGIKRHILVDDIDIRLGIEKQLKFEKIAALQERLFNDMELRIALHHELCRVLREYQYSEDNKVIGSLIESLKTEYFEKLSIHFGVIMENEFKSAKKDLEKQIQMEKNHAVKTKAKLVLCNVQKIEMNENDKQTPNYGHLTEYLQEVGHKLGMENRLEAGQRLCDYAQYAHGHASWEQQRLGIAIMALGVVLFVSGILIATTMVIPTFGLNIAVGIKFSVGGFCLFSIGAGLFYNGRQKNVSKALRQTGAALLQSPEKESTTSEINVARI